MGDPCTISFSLWRLTRDPCTGVITLWVTQGMPMGRPWANTTISRVTHGRTVENFVNPWATYAKSLGETEELHS